MKIKGQPHVQNLRQRVKIAFTHAAEHFDQMAFIHEDAAYALRAREIQAGLTLLDTLVSNDRFTSLGALNAICWALAMYRHQLEMDKYQLKAWMLRDLIVEIDAVREKCF